MIDRSWRIILAFLPVSLLLLHPAPAHTTAVLELYPTFHAMGVIVTIGATDNPDGVAVATVEYRSDSGPYRAGFPLSRTSDTHFVGSLFWLEPGTTYDVRVTFDDPDGLLHSTTVTDTASTRVEISVPEAGGSYYVSPIGAGTACSLAAPCSLTEGLSQAQPGEEVVLRGNDGVYFQGDFSLPRSGTSGQPIVIRSHEGETAVLDGADPTTFTWMALSNGVYHTTVNVVDTHLVTAAGQRLFPYQDLTNLENLSRDNTPGFYADGTSLYVHLAGDANPNDTTMVVSRHESAFTVEQDHI